MESDRELLERAAKAADYRVAPHGRTDGAFMVLMNDDGDFIWNPLTDDGDAFRLAVKLGLVLNLSPRQDARGQTVVTYHGFCKIEEPCYDGEAAAARRAIVRAAAELGKEMK